MNKIFKFIKEAKEELRKVSWPSKKKTVNYTVTVVIVSLLVALFLGVLDIVFSLMIENFFI